MNIRGVVKLEAHVSPKGAVKSGEVKGGDAVLTHSAVIAVERREVRARLSRNQRAG
jgi:hypothetical protein